MGIFTSMWIFIKMQRFQKLTECMLWKNDVWIQKLLCTKINIINFICYDCFGLFYLNKNLSRSCLYSFYEKKRFIGFIYFPILNVEWRERKKGEKEEGEHGEAERLPLLLHSQTDQTSLAFGLGEVRRQELHPDLPHGSRNQVLGPS